MADGGTSDAGSGHRLPRAVGRWAPAGAERGLGARGRRQVCFRKDQISTILISIHQPESRTQIINLCVLHI